MTNRRRSFGLSCYAQVPQASRSWVVSRTSKQPTPEIVHDAGGYVLKTTTAPTLLEKLLMRADGKGLPATPKRGRGRPRKGGAA